MQRAAALVGIVFLAVGLLGFVPGLTTHYGTMAAAGAMSHALLLGLFRVSVLHNVVHLLFGVAGLVLARSITNAKRYLVVGGAGYALLFVYGIAVPMGSAANVAPVNRADHVLRLGLAIGMICLGSLLTRRPDLEPATGVATE